MRSSLVCTAHVTGQVSRLVCPLTQVVELSKLQMDLPTVHLHATTVM